MIVIPKGRLTEIGKQYHTGFVRDFLIVATLKRDEYSVEDEVWARLTSSGLGDKVERLIKPIALALKLDCLDKDGQLKKESGCAKRRDKLNKIGKVFSSL